MERERNSLTNAPKESTIDVGEFRINYARAGKGDHLILLHGSDPRESWRIWQPLLPLADRFALIMPDLIGYGGSTKPAETPDYKLQARVVSEMMDRLAIQRATLIGSTWGGQVSLQIAIEQPERVRSLVLVSSTYDKSQLPRLVKVKRPALIFWAEDNMVAQLKAGYLLRDAIGTSRLEVLDSVAKDPRHNFRIAHQLERYRGEILVRRIVTFLEDPDGTVREPPGTEPELRGLALKAEKSQDDER